MGGKAIARGHAATSTVASSRTRWNDTPNTVPMSQTGRPAAFRVCAAAHTAADRPRVEYEQMYCPTQATEHQDA